MKASACMRVKKCVKCEIKILTHADFFSCSVSCCLYHLGHILGWGNNIKTFLERVQFLSFYDTESYQVVIDAHIEVWFWDFTVILSIIESC